MKNEQMTAQHIEKSNNFFGAKNFFDDEISKNDNGNDRIVSKKFNKNRCLYTQICVQKAIKA